MQHADPLELTFTVQLLLLLVAAAAGTEVARRLKASAVAGQIVAGMILGAAFKATGAEVILPLRDLGTFGILLLLFSAGLQMDLRSLMRSGIAATVVAACGVALPLVGGTAVAKAFGYPLMASLFAGATLVATSVAITVEMLRETDLIRSRMGALIIGAAVVDDVLGIFILSTFAGIATKKLSLSHSALLVAAAVAFFAISFALVGPLLRRFVAFARGLNQPITRPDGTVKLRRRRRLVHIPEAALFAGLSLMLAYSVVAELLGLAMITGAFLAGLLMGDTPLGQEIHRKFGAMGNALFYPVFFVVMGMDFQVGAFLQAGWFALAFIVAAILTKVAGCGLSARHYGYPGLAVGVCMVPRAEVALIIAKIGYDGGIVGDEIFSAALVMVVATSVLTPIVGHFFLARLKQADAQQDDRPSAQ